MADEDDLFQTACCNIRQQFCHDIIHAKSHGIFAAFASAAGRIKRDRPAKLAAALLLEGGHRLAPNPSALPATMQEHVVARKCHCTLASFVNAKPGSGWPVWMSTREQCMQRGCRCFGLFVHLRTAPHAAG